ncbi:MAG: flippase-like domain-containing protein [Planctomycetota bacterium]|nr:flippase-like domain-containing protein [Planctomycetota bacterium]
MRTEEGAGASSRRGLSGVFASFGLSYLLGLLLLAALVYHAGVWNVLANTRLLDPLVEVGVIRYHDGNLGVVDGVEDQKHYLRSQDPIDYRLVLLAALIYFAYWGVKGLKYHGVARFVGLKGSAGRHARARLYGDGLGIFFPFRFGEAATAAALEAEGEEPERVRQTFVITDFLTIVFQIILFLLFGLLVTNYAIWFAQTFWALVICAVSYFVLRGSGLLPWGPAGFWRTQSQTYRSLANQPGTLGKLGFVSALLMLLDDLTPFVIAMAFTGDHVIMNVPFFVIQSGVVAGYIARRFPITPHGIGQWEWAFAAALYASGIGFPEAATIALLDSALRHGTCFIVFLIVTLRHGVATTYHQVMGRYLDRAASEQPPAAPAAEAGATGVA